MSKNAQALLCAAVALAAFFALVAVARAHDFWITGKAVDPQTKVMCCGQNDCAIVPVDKVHEVAGGYQLDASDRSPAEFIPYERVQPSPDGAFWACRWGGETKCFFAPFKGA